MSIINIKNLTFAYCGNYENIFENVNLQIDSTWKLGLIGRNGRGKTTLLNILKGKLKYYGNIHSNMQFDYFPFDIENTDRDTIEIIYEINQSLEYWQLIKEMNLLNLNEEILYKNFNKISGGEKTKIMLCVLFLKENNFLLIDEPTNHLDENARENLAKYLNKKEGYILVSHDRLFLDNCVDHILSINKNNIELQKGNFSSFKENKDKHDKFEIATNDKLENDIARLKNASKRKENWAINAEKEKFGNDVPDRGFAGHKAAKIMKTSKVLENRINNAILEKSSLLKNIEKNVSLKISTLNHCKDNLIEIKNLSFFYKNNVFSNINFSLNSNDRICIKGKNGCGKSTLLKFILFINYIKNNNINLNEKHNAFYDYFEKKSLHNINNFNDNNENIIIENSNNFYTEIKNNININSNDYNAKFDKNILENDLKNNQKINEINNEIFNNTNKNDLKNLDNNIIKYDNFSFSGEYNIASNLLISYVSQDTSYLKGNLSNFAKDYDLDESLFKTILYKMDFSRNQFELNIEKFSNGQKKKVLIAKSLAEKAHVYIWDEPLNFIDIFSRIQIEELILKNMPTLIFVEHDKLFSTTIATKTIEFY